jgi:hypothetical protein
LIGAAIWRVTLREATELPVATSSVQLAVADAPAVTVPAAPGDSKSVAGLAGGFHMETL